MDLPGESYFYTLAQVGITFSGFSAMLLAVQQMRGVALSGFHKWVAKIYVVSGMVTATNSMLPPLLFGLGLDETATWRLASLLIAAGSIYRLSLFPQQWREATNRPLDRHVKAHVAFIIVLNAGLLMNAAGWPFGTSGGVVMFAVSWSLFAFFFQFTESFRYFFDEDVEMDT